MTELQLRALIAGVRPSDIAELIDSGVGSKRAVALLERLLALLEQPRPGETFLDRIERK